MNFCSLKDLCSDVAQTHILRSTYLDYNVELDTFSSNELYHAMQQNDPSFPHPEIVNYIAMKMNVTHVNVEDCFLDNNKINMISQFSLDLLVLGDYYNFTCTEEKPKFCMEEFLKKLLNEYSRLKLQHLAMNGLPVGRSKRWAKSVSLMLPALTNLVISGVKLSASEFSSICDNFQLLHWLDISDTGIANLQGIWKISNLEILAIGGLHFTRASQMAEITYLKKLKHLELVSRRFNTEKEYLLKMYMDCKYRLRNLEFIDCSSNHMTEILVWKLVQSHRHLQKIAVVDTRVTLTRIGKTNLLTTSSLKSATETLNHYIGTQNKKMIEIAMDKVWEERVSYFDDAEDTVLTDWFDAICKVAEKFRNRHHLYSISTQHLASFLRENRVMLLTTADRHRLFRVLTSTWDSFHSCASMGNCEHESQLQTFQIFNNDELLNTPGLDLADIYRNISEVAVVKAVNPPKEVCLDAMSKILTILKNRNSTEIFDDDELLKDLLDLLPKLYKWLARPWYRKVAILIDKLTESSLDAFVSLGGVNIFAHHLKRFKFIEVFNILTRVAQSSKHKEELLKPMNFQKLRYRFGRIVSFPPSQEPEIMERMYSVSSLMATLLVGTENRTTYPNLKLQNDKLAQIFTRMRHQRMISTEQHKMANLLDVLFFCDLHGPLAWALWTTEERLRNGSKISRRNFLFLVRILTYRTREGKESMRILIANFLQHIRLFEDEYVEEDEN
ncbi:CBN-GADR-3 protein [Caenorhabditis brenneri]|uniref:CBN-GADR-3 protein n=1 Tax=Caenorhabditis brenneri TaxID=135651 RepID=G0M7E6_CAEBE|nr:CBN-GADR-3 protein [Caenorhabditis brenneri]